MGDGTLIDVVLFAMVAAFLFLAPAQRAGPPHRPGAAAPQPLHPPRPEQQRPDPRPDTGGVVPLPTRRVEPSRPRPEVGGDAARHRFARSSSPIHFHETASSPAPAVAFEMIVEAYARGDLATCGRCSPTTSMKDSAGAIKSRDAAGETLERTLSGIRNPRHRRGAPWRPRRDRHRQVVSDQTNIPCRSLPGTVLDGDPAKAGRGRRSVDVLAPHARQGSTGP